MKFEVGTKVIVNTGGADTVAIIDYPEKAIHGYYWKEQDCYLCRFTGDIKKTLVGGAKHKASAGDYSAENNTLVTNAQYIGAKYLRKEQTND